MKTIAKLFKKNPLRLTLIVLFISAFAVSCSDDDENPEAVDEEEVITTMKITLSASGSSINLESQDLDGDGPNAPTISVSGNLVANTSYSGVIELLNETETPAENITEEVEEEDEDHQFFFTTGGAISEVVYSDQDGNGNPVGINFSLTTGDAGTGTLQVTLRHEPKKPNNGTLADAGGETDIAQNFSITVE